MKSPTFDTTRFSKYFTCYTATNSRRLWLYAAIILITWLLVCILPPVMTLFSSYSYDLPADPAWETEGTWAFLLLMLFTGLSGAMFYSSFNPRGARVQVLTAPASSFEKFLTWFIIYFFGMIAVFYASAFIADLIRVGVVKAFAACPSTARPISALEIFGLAIDKPFDQINAPDVLQWIGFYGLALSNFAIFALGSIVFYAKNRLPRRPQRCPLLHRLRLIQGILRQLLVRTPLRSRSHHNVQLHPRRNLNNRLRLPLMARLPTLQRSRHRKPLVNLRPCSTTQTRQSTSR